MQYECGETPYGAEKEEGATGIMAFEGKNGQRRKAFDYLLSLGKTGRNPSNCPPTGTSEPMTWAGGRGPRP